MAPKSPFQLDKKGKRMHQLPKGPVFQGKVTEIKAFRKDLIESIANFAGHLFITSSKMTIFVEQK